MMVDDDRLDDDGLAAHERRRPEIGSEEWYRVTGAVEERDTYEREDG